MRLRIKNGRIIDPANKLDDSGDVCIADGKIVSVLNSTSEFSADEEIDASNKREYQGQNPAPARPR